MRDASDEALLRVLSGLTALVFLTYAVLVSGSDPLLTIPALALLDCGIRGACRATLG
jgi:hypothetical protein